MPRTAAPDWVTAVPIAHRGLHDAAAGVPENSLAAFEAAAVRGYPIELDTWLSRDHVPMVFHDETLDRMTGEAGRLRDRTAGELAELRLAGTDERIPTLADALATVARRVPVFVELKVHRGRLEGLEPRVWDVLARYGGPVAVLSFHPLALAWYRRHAPRVPRGQSSSDFADVSMRPRVKRLLSTLRLNRVSRPHFISYDLAALPSPAAERARASGLPLVTWTVRTPAERERAESLADNYMFEGIAPGPAVP